MKCSLCKSRKAVGGLKILDVELLLCMKCYKFHFSKDVILEGKEAENFEKDLNKGL